jgi:hypothetical protein
MSRRGFILAFFNTIEAEAPPADSSSEEDELEEDCEELFKLSASPRTGVVADSFALGLGDEPFFLVPDLSSSCSFLHNSIRSPFRPG